MIRHLGERFPAELIRRYRLLACMAACVVLFVSLSCSNSPTDGQGGSKAAPEVVEIPTGNFTAQWRAEVPLGQTQPRSIHLNEDKVLLYTSDNKCIWVNRASGHIVSIVQAAKSTDTLYAPVTLADRVVFPSTSELSVFNRNGKLMHKI